MFKKSYVLSYAFPPTIHPQGIYEVPDGFDEMEALLSELGLGDLDEETMMQLQKQEPEVRNYVRMPSGQPASDGRCYPTRNTLLIASVVVSLPDFMRRAGRLYPHPYPCSKGARASINHRSYSTSCHLHLSAATRCHQASCKLYSWSRPNFRDCLYLSSL